MAKQATRQRDKQREDEHNGTDDREHPPRQEGSGKDSSGRGDDGQDSSGQGGDGAQVSAREAARRATEYMDEMTGAPPEVVSGVERHHDGWLVTVEMLELARVPNTTDVLGCYQVSVDATGEPSSYRRIRRYHRGHVGEDA